MAGWNTEFSFEYWTMRVKTYITKKVRKHANVTDIMERSPETLQAGYYEGRSIEQTGDAIISRWENGA